MPRLLAIRSARTGTSPNYLRKRVRGTDIAVAIRWDRAGLEAREYGIGRGEGGYAWAVMRTPRMDTLYFAPRPRFLVKTETY